jgi:hypothetical protein
MRDVADKLMTVDEFLVWAEGREGKRELHDGQPVSMAPERIAHTRALLAPPSDCRLCNIRRTLQRQPGNASFVE